jgi:hypothetical protein
VQSVELDRLQPCTAAHLPFTNEKFLCARRRISFSKYTRKPMTGQQEPEGGISSIPCPVPRMVSLRSSGMPAHKWLLPSTIVRHSSRAACSASAPEGRRCASNALKESKVVRGGAGGIKRKRRERISPAWRYRECVMPVMRLRHAVSSFGTVHRSMWEEGGKRKVYLWKGHLERG